MTTLLPPDLARLGDDLERAIAGQLAQATDTLAQLPARRDLRRLVRTTRRRVLVAGAGAVLAIGGAVGAAASGLVGPHEVEVALPGSAAIFTGFTPVCQALENGDEFRCTVDDGGNAPGLPPDRERGGYLGFVTGLHDEVGNEIGGCRGQDRAGEVWLCYIGQKAVDEQIISQDYLGEWNPPGPGVG